MKICERIFLKFILPKNFRIFLSFGTGVHQDLTLAEGLKNYDFAWAPEPKCIQPG